MALKCRNVFARNQDVNMHKYGLLDFFNNLFILHLWSLNVNCIFFVQVCCAVNELFDSNVIIKQSSV